MLKLWNPTNFWRTLGGLGLILAPVLFAINEITYPVGDGTAAQQLDQAAQNQSVMIADVYIGIASGLLFFPAVYALVHVTRRRGAVLGTIAALLTATGVALAHLALGGLQLMLWAMAGPGVDRAAMTTFLDHSMQNPAGLPLVLGHNLFALGLILFGVAVWRSGFGYRWTGPAISLGIIADIVAGVAGLPDIAASVISDAIFVTALAAVGLRVLMTSDSEWTEGEESRRNIEPARAGSAATTTA